MTASEVVELLAHVADAFPGRFTVGPGVIRVWATMLEDVDASDAIRALKDYLTTGVHPPAIADIRTRIASMRIGAPDVAEAWEEVRRAIARVGHLRSPDWSSPVIAGAVDAIGWRELCASLEADMPTVRAQFERYFRARLDTRQKRENFGALEARQGDRLGSASAADAVARLLKAPSK